MNILFKRAGIEDTQRLLEVQKMSFYDDYIEYGECPGYEHSLEYMENIIKTSVICNIIYNDVIVGDIVVRKRENNNYYLGGICIIPEYQNFGIGQRTIMHIEKDNVSAVCWELETHFNRYRNHHFYEKMGYKKIGEYRHSYKLVLFKFKKIV
ncbi:GNAT family N-acetyltransferase [Clostridium sp. P21]|uniref:GNAT family N-acetyltransferase n=1 Tax=Clostridium muellerianum TaxID=2716538 RepID=A0A7Y0EK53_9CLOT|nr:GNAT family N-acetyltransferase [Clostridium muellerianum]NMM64954.1 GNAT family N-acetyltransferase [Clostridium muellerianum]